MKLHYFPIAALLILSSCFQQKSEQLAETTEAVQTNEVVDQIAIYNTDTAKSSLVWSGKSITDEHQGFITLKSGNMQFNGKELKGGEFVLDMASVKAVMHEKEHDSEKDLEKLSKHLKAKDFFDAESFPEATFVITSVSKPAITDSTQTTLDISGNLTIKGISKNITFPATLDIKDEYILANAEFNIDRNQWGVNYRSEESWKNKMISPFLSFKIVLQCTK